MGSLGVLFQLYLFFFGPRFLAGFFLKGTLLNPASGSRQRDLIERVYLPKNPSNPNSHFPGFLERSLCKAPLGFLLKVLWFLIGLSLNFREGFL